jgi:methyl coenzyme M reductase subunit D
MPIISSIVSSVVNIFTKILPFLFAYKAGKNSAEKKELEDAIEKNREADKIEEDIDRMADDAVVSKLRKRWRRKDNDKLTGGTARRILAHNETWNKFCN